MGGLAGCLHPNTTCHFSSSSPPPLSLQTVRWRGIQETVGMVYRVDEQCGVAGALRCVNFMFSFFFFTDPPTPNILQTNARIFVARPRPHRSTRYACPSTKQMGGYSITGPAPPIAVTPPTTLLTTNTGADVRDEPMTALASLLSDVKGAFLL